jgi:hypothetical protein
MTLCLKIAFFFFKKKNKIIRVELTLKYHILFIFSFLGPNGYFILFFNFF